MHKTSEGITPENLYEVEITGYAHNGLGVGRINNQVVFVENALVGERALIRLKNRRRGYFEAGLVKILQNHEDRVTPRCPVYYSCGGCQIQHAAYPEQLKLKKQLVADTLRRIGGLNQFEVHPTLGMKDPWAYRNKGHFRVCRVNHTGHNKERIVLGFYEEGSYTIAEEPCRYLFSPAVTRLLFELEDILNVFTVRVADKGRAGLHHLLVRESNYNGEIILVFIGCDINSQDMRKISQEICRRFSQVVGICYNNNPHLTGPVLAGRTTLIWGKEQIEDKIGECRFKISPESFFQINISQTRILYEKALDYAALTGSETVIDAYCGIGTISLFLAAQAKKVIGIESVKEAVLDARENAVLNRIANVEFIQGLSEQVMPKLVKQGLRPDVVVLDPPRRGCETPMLAAILQVKPERVVYVSCNPATLARDLRYLTQGGYEVKEVQPVDMFPQTAHVECVVLMSRV